MIFFNFVEKNVLSLFSQCFPQNTRTRMQRHTHFCFKTISLKLLNEKKIKQKQDENYKKTICSLTITSNCKLNVPW